MDSSSNAGPSPSTVDQAEIRGAISTLLEVGAPAELRVIDARGVGTLTGIYNDHPALERDAVEWSGNARAVFVTLNPIRRALMPVATNRLHSLREELPDHAIQCRRWLPIDFDPVRPIGTNSTDNERLAAWEMALAVRDWLRQSGWPEPVFADSGNGAHLLYRIELPNTAISTRLVHVGLAALDLRFSDRMVTVDAVVEDAARLWKLYGTMVRKGPPSAERPHRLSRILEVPSAPTVAPSRLIEELPRTFGPPRR